MDPDKKSDLIEELKLMTDDYRYRDQLMVTEFGLSITAIAIAGNAGLRSESWHLQLVILLVTFIFSVLIANHLTRLNVDRISAGNRRKDLLGLIGMHQPHHGFKRKQARFTFPAPITFVYFAWLMSALLSSAIFYIICSGQILN